MHVYTLVQYGLTHSECVDTSIVLFSDLFLSSMDHVKRRLL